MSHTSLSFLQNSSFLAFWVTFIFSSYHFSLKETDARPFDNERASYL